MSDVIISNKIMPFKWTVDKNEIYMIRDGKKHQVKTFMYMANGTKDLLSVTDKKGKLVLRTKSNIKPTDTIICAWEDDVLILQFFKTLPPPFNRKVLYVEVNDSLTPFVDTVFRLHPQAKPEDYDAFLGRRYPNLDAEICELSDTEELS